MKFGLMFANTGPYATAAGVVDLATAAEGAGLPERNPLVLAKSVATLDSLSGGRLDLGIGVGWLKEEFEALGIPFEDRGARTDDYVGAMRALWASDQAHYDGDFAKFDGVTSNPKPANGDVPIVIGGHAKAAAPPSRSAR